MPTSPPALSRAASYATAAAVAALALWSSGAPSMIYPLYAARWHLTETTTTAVFALYPLVLVITLIVLGDLSDHIGRRATILWGLAALLVGSLLFAVAPNIAVVFLGRAFMGLGVGLALSPASAAVVEFSRPGRESIAGPVTTAATAVGLSLATVVGGALVEYADWPMHLSFWVLSVGTLVVAVGVWFLPRHTSAETTAPWRPRPVHIAPELRGLYVVSTLAVSVAYMFGSIFLALGAEIAEVLIDTHNAFVVGVVMAVMSACIGVTAIAGRRMPPLQSITAGAALTPVALGLLLVASEAGSLPVFLVTTLLSGSTYAFLFSGGLGLINQQAPAHHRAGTFSAVYLVAYVMQGAAAVGLGLVATHEGLSRALWIGVPVVVAVALAELVALTLLRPLLQPPVAVAAH